MTNPTDPTSATDPALTADELARLAEYLRAHGVPVAGELRADLISGGRSNLTFRVADDARRWVLRTPPRHGRTPSAHDMGREFRVTSALAGTGVPVPPAVAHCEDESVLGGPFQLTEFVDGATIRSRAELDALDDPTVDGTVTALLEALARLHRVDHVAVGLGDFGRPDGYAGRQLRRWSGQWEIVGPALGEQTGALADELVGRLRRDLPEQRAVGIVHGDYRIDNTLLRLEPAPAVAAIVDWELSTIGDPVADVAMMCAYRLPAFDLVLGMDSAWVSPRIPDAAELAQRYTAAGGVELAHWDFHLALAYYKVAVIAAGIAHRHREGAGAGSDEGDTAAQAVAPYLQAGLDAYAG